MNPQVYSESEIRKKLKKSLKKLREKDKYLLDIAVNERTITHRLAMYIQELFPDWHVDCEYNRDGMDKKALLTLFININSDDLDAKTVFPDIIIHERGEDNNLLVIEVKKKCNNDQLKDKDLKKLNAYKNELKYKHIAFLCFNLSENSFDDSSESFFDLRLNSELNEIRGEQNSLNFN